tara:strand:- start:1236 stop:1730 length:495 start_codon:yes stop_codon:yes gene_type:complete
MYTKITQTPYVTMTLEEAKAHLRLDDGFIVDDDYINTLIPLTGELVQNHTNKMLSSGTVVAESDDYWCSFHLPYGNIVSIEEVLIDGEATTDYEFSEITQKITVNPAYSKIKVSYTVTVSEIPVAAIHGAKLILTHLYNDRGDGNVDPSDIARKVLSGAKFYGI